MKRTAIVWLFAASCLLSLTLWISNHTYWTDVSVPMPPKGEAFTNPFYAAQRFAEVLGAHTRRDRVFVTPPSDSVIVLSAWHWDLSRSRREALERWVESGGRLVVDGRLSGGRDEFERWSGIGRGYRKPDEAAGSNHGTNEDSCRTFREEHGRLAADSSETTGYLMCDFARTSFLTSNGPIDWALGGQNGIQAMRRQVGRGRVTVINATPFGDRSLFAGDHGWLFVAATELRRGDEVHFLSEEDHPSLLALLWQHGGPVVVLTLGLIAVALWRAGVRFGPLAAPPQAARRSLAEQIRGTGQFALRYGGGEALHAASVRALDSAAQRRVPGYALLSITDRTAAVAGLTGLDRGLLAAAIYHPAARRPHQLCSTIALVETARRRILIRQTRSSNGTN